MERDENGTPVCEETSELDRLRARVAELAAYALALQRAIEAHCREKLVPKETAALCPHHAQKLNAALKDDVEAALVERDRYYLALRRIAEQDYCGRCDRFVPYPNKYDNRTDTLKPL